MKHILSLFIAFCFIFSAMNAFSSEELRGPNIKGFQLGQTKSAAEENFKRLGYEFDTYLPKDVPGLLPSNGILLESTNGLKIVLTDNIVKKIEILNSGLTDIFNAKGSRKGFLQAFIDNYRIPELSGNVETKTDFTSGMSINITRYTYVNDEEGWRVECISFDDNIEVENIEIESIQKVEKFNF